MKCKNQSFRGRLVHPMLQYFFVCRLSSFCTDHKIIFSFPSSDALLKHAVSQILPEERSPKERVQKYIFTDNKGDNIYLYLLRPKEMSKEEVEKHSRRSASPIMQSSINLATSSFVQKKKTNEQKKENPIQWGYGVIIRKEMCPYAPKLLRMLADQIDSKHVGLEALGMIMTLAQLIFPPKATDLSIELPDNIMQISAPSTTFTPSQKYL